MVLTLNRQDLKERITARLAELKGGSGSGNFGHGGRPGEVGGSSPEHDIANKILSKHGYQKISSKDVDTKKWSEYSKGELAKAEHIWRLKDSQNGEILTLRKDEIGSYRNGEALDSHFLSKSDPKGELEEHLQDLKEDYGFGSSKGAANQNSTNKISKDDEEEIHLSANSNLTHEEAIAVRDYSDEDTVEINYVGINNFLRTGETDDEVKDVKERIKLIDSAFKKNTLNKDLTVYRGTDIQESFGKNIDQLRVGQTLKDKGYLSTSVDRSWVKENYTSTKEEGVLLQINLQKGQSALDMNAHGIGVIKQEKEILLPRNLSLRIDNIKTVKIEGENRKLITLSVVNKTASNKKSLPLEYLKSEYNYASTQINISDCLPDGQDIADQILKLGQQIDKKLLDDKGLEDTIHVTIKYGLHDEDPTTLKKLLSFYHGLNFTIGKLDVFNAEDTGADYDVVILRVISSDLVGLNKLITENLDNTETFKYTPHVTVAYVKAGTGQDIISNLENPVQNKTLRTDFILFSDKDGKMTRIPLGGTANMASKIDRATLSYNIRTRLNELQMEAKGGPGSGRHPEGHAQAKELKDKLENTKPSFTPLGRDSFHTREIDSKTASALDKQLTGDGYNKTTHIGSEGETSHTYDKGEKGATIEHYGHLGKDWEDTHVVSLEHVGDPKTYNQRIMAKK